MFNIYQGYLCYAQDDQKCLLARCNMYLFITCSNNAVNKWRTSTSNTHRVNRHHKIVSSFLFKYWNSLISLYLSKCYVCFKINFCFQIILLIKPVKIIQGYNYFVNPCMNIQHI